MERDAGGKIDIAYFLAVRKLKTIVMQLVYILSQTLLGYLSAIFSNALSEQLEFQTDPLPVFTIDHEC